MKEIKLTKGMSALVDDDDCEWISKSKWRAHTTPANLSSYAIRNIRLSKNKRSSSRMHVEIMKKHGLYVDGLQVDHIDGNGLNNQKSNLRMCTQSQNCSNTPKRWTNKSG
jgi:hypothetical protein